MAETGGGGPISIVCDLATRFVGFIDSGRAEEAATLCADSFRLVRGDQLAGVDELLAGLRERASAGYQSRHAVGVPRLDAVSDEAIRAFMPVVSYRLMDGVLSIAVVDFDLEAKRTGSGWRLSEIGMAPYAMQAFP